LRVLFRSIRSNLFAGSGRAASAAPSSGYGRPGVQMSASGGGPQRSHGSGGAAHGLNDRIYAEQTERMMESQNDELTNRLSEKVNLLKQLSIDIGVEVKEQNKMLDEMDVDFESTQGFMKKTLGGMTQMLNTGGSKHMCYLVLFIFALFILVYWLVR
jgi:blocked-early-in-transport protein 1